MANIKVKGAQNTAVSRESEGAFVYARGTRDGSLVAIPWIQSLLLEGRVFFANVGNATTAITLDASWANTDPDISLDVPSGTSIIPLRITVVFEAYGTAAVCETMALCSKTLGASSAGTVFIPINLNNRSANGSLCACYVGPTVTSGYTTGGFELFRDCQQAAATQATEAGTPYKYEWSVGKDGFAPVLQGESSLQVWATSQAATGYIQIIWAELPTSAIA